MICLPLLLLLLLLLLLECAERRPATNCEKVTRPVAGWVCGQYADRESCAGWTPGNQGPACGYH